MKLLLLASLVLLTGCCTLAEHRNNITVDNDVLEIKFHGVGSDVELLGIRVYAITKPTPYEECMKKMGCSKSPPDPYGFESYQCSSPLWSGVCTNEYDIKAMFVKEG